MTRSPDKIIYTFCNGHLNASSLDLVPFVVCERTIQVAGIEHATRLVRRVFHGCSLQRRPAFVPPSSLFSRNSLIQTCTNPSGKMHRRSQRLIQLDDPSSSLTSFTPKLPTPRSASRSTTADKHGIGLSLVSTLLSIPSTSNFVT